MLSLSNITKNSSFFYKKQNSLYWLNFYLNFSNISNIYFYTYDFNYKKSNWKENLLTTNTLNFKLYFLKNEPFYTKLKYSRVPQFDTSSGAAASFLSGMYGFLVCEKFGFELIDSGDFLYLILYLILYYFLGSLLLTVFNSTSNLFNYLVVIFKSFKS